MTVPRQAVLLVVLVALGCGSATPSADAGDRPAGGGGGASAGGAGGGGGGDAGTDAGTSSSPWLDADIGSVGLAGSSTFTSESAVTVNAAGNDIYDTADGFHFVYQPLQGDAELVARVESLTNTSPYAKAGVMVRQSLDPSSAFAFASVWPQNGAFLEWRAANGQTVSAGTIAAQSPPAWVKLVRRGGTLAGSFSLDGASWTSLGTQSIALSGTVFIGLAVTSHDVTKLATASFTGLSLTPLPAVDGGTGLPTTPPNDGTTPWAPAPGDPDWVNVKDKGAVGDALADDTQAFRDAAATGKKIFVPKPPTAYKLTAFVALQNSIYGDGSLPELRMFGADGDPNQGHTHNVFWVYEYTGAGLVIQGLHLNGQWSGGANGEWSHGVHIASSKNVSVQHNIIELMYGDDVNIDQYDSYVPSFAPDSIRVTDNVLGEPRRCNVGVVSGTNVVIQNNAIKKTISNYVSAIDLEPDPLGYQHVSGVQIDGNQFDAVQFPGAGNAVSLYNPPGNSAAPQSGNVAVSNSCGHWVPTAASISGSGGLVNYVGGTLPWVNVTFANNIEGSSGCGPKL